MLTPSRPLTNPELDCGVASFNKQLVATTLVNVKILCHYLEASTILKLLTCVVCRKFPCHHYSLPLYKTIKT